MEALWIILLIALAIGAVAGTIDALLRQRAPRTPVDPERLARLRERVEDTDARRIAAEVEERIAHRLDAPGNGLAPQMGDARVWAGAY